MFESPRCAVGAAIDVQRDFLARSWIESLDVRVRIGIHSGYPTSTDDNYIGVDVNTAARICAVGHGGQIVVSANTREAVKASEPSGVRFTALGNHKLRGITKPVPLFQVTTTGPAHKVPTAAEVLNARGLGVCLR